MCFMIVRRLVGNLVSHFIVVLRVSQAAMQLFPSGGLLIIHIALRAYAVIFMLTFCRIPACSVV